MERNYLYDRYVEYNTETPRECHVVAMYHVFKGEKIPKDVYDAVLMSAERRRDVLKHTMDLANKSVDNNVAMDMSRLNMVALAGSIVAANGIDGPKASKRRLDYLGKYFEEYLLYKELGSTE